MDKGKSVYLSHNQSDARCPICVQLSSIQDDLPQEVLEVEAADQAVVQKVQLGSY